MTPENAATASPAPAPSVHVWLTVEEAARALDTSAALVSCQLELGELESRLSDDGATEVLVELPPRADAADCSQQVGVAIVPQSDGSDGLLRGADPNIPALAGALVPMLQAMREAQRQEVRAARRWARLAWSVAASLLVASAAAAFLAARTIDESRAKSLRASDDLTRLAQERQTLAAERDGLRARLGQARQAAAHLEGQLAVERQVEDTLFKAALARHASPEPSSPSPRNGPVVANSAD